eukprot:Phypoly_transcript_07520.p1 GENE.Phypoly_transcript_07520~~Phypoly_transcript_07520.p1  ORF type:complete len:344 (+),score=59.76 Phypoly_transcript_07520:162-1193(+)
MANINIQALTDFARSHQRTQIIYSVLKYGFAEVLKDGSKTGEEIATLAKTHEGRTCRVLRYAAAMGLFTVDPETLKYSLNDVSRELVDKPYLKWMLMHYSHPHTVHAWSNLPKSLEGGDYPHKDLFGVNMWEFCHAQPGYTEDFNKAMTSLAGTLPFPGSFAKAYDFSKAKHVVDVAGGHGVLLTEILLEHPHLTGTSFDLPATIEETKNPINLPKDFSKVQSRFSYAAGDFFVSVPEGGDVYTLKFIVHDWIDSEAIKILKNIHKAMPSHGKLVVIELEIAETNDLEGCMMDLHVMVMLDGLERTKAAYTKLLKEAGFKVTAFIPLACAPPNKMHAIESEKI